MKEGGEETVKFAVSFVSILIITQQKEVEDVNSWTGEAVG